MNLADAKQTFTFAAIGRLLAGWWNKCPGERTTHRADIERLISLSPHDLFVIPRVSCPRTIRCVEGPVWITQSGSTRDLLLRSGDSAELGRGGKVVIQALGFAEVRL